MSESSKSGIISATNGEDFDKILMQFKTHLVVVHFQATWAAQCQQINDVLVELEKRLGNADVKFVKVEAESLPDVSQKFNITAVPTCVLLKNLKEVDRINGANAPELSRKVQQQASVTLSPKTSDKEDLKEHLKALINKAPVMVFMKGSPDQPKCGFSRTLVQILNDEKVTFNSFDILTDEEVRQGLKEYSDWPTYPQVYINGELVGGLDIIKELIANDEFQLMIPKQQSMEEKLKELINRDKVMLFMKGSPDTPRCGFSKSIIEILNSKSAKFDYFDILQDEAVREGLKKFSNWPTYPQLYIKGELIGGLDIVKELNESGELDSVLKDGQ